MTTLDFSGLTDVRPDWREKPYPTQWAIDCGAEEAEAAVRDLEEGRTADAIEKLLTAVTWYGIGNDQYTLKDVTLYDRGINALRRAKNTPTTKVQPLHEQLSIAK
jgi:hypothetical protein